MHRPTKRPGGSATEGQLRSEGGTLSPASPEDSLLRRRVCSGLAKARLAAVIHARAFNGQHDLQMGAHVRLSCPGEQRVRATACACARARTRTRSDACHKRSLTLVATASACVARSVGPMARTSSELKASRITPPLRGRASSRQSMGKKPNCARANGRARGAQHARGRVRQLAHRRTRARSRGSVCEGARHAKSRARARAHLFREFCVERRSPGAEHALQEAPILHSALPVDFEDGHTAPALRARPLQIVLPAKRGCVTLRSEYAPTVHL